MSVLRAFALAVTLTAGFVPLAQSQEQEPERDFGAEDDPVLIPEPMVFDLVRGLGADKGELEVNVLGVFPLESSDPRETEWAPEIAARSSRLRPLTARWHSSFRS